MIGDSTSNTSISVDAIRVGVKHAGAGTAAERLGKLTALFATTLGASRVFIRNQGGEYFITADSADTILFPGASNRSGEPRYHWESRGDGVHYGYLKSQDC